MLNNRSANNFPAFIAGGVNSILPSQTSPIAKILHTEVLSSLLVIILLLAASFIKGVLNNLEVSGDLPTACKTVSKIAECSPSGDL